MLEKKNCENETTWDIVFCVRVCLLHVGDACLPDAPIGEGRCTDSSECTKMNDSSDDSSIYTCQPLTEVIEIYDSSGGARSFDGKVIHLLFGKNMFFDCSISHVIVPDYSLVIFAC